MRFLADTDLLLTAPLSIGRRPNEKYNNWNTPLKHIFAPRNEDVLRIVYEMLHYYALPRSNAVRDITVLSTLMYTIKQVTKPKYQR